MEEAYDSLGFSRKSLPQSASTPALPTEAMVSSVRMPGSRSNDGDLQQNTKRCEVCLQNVQRRTFSSKASKCVTSSLFLTLTCPIWQDPKNVLHAKIQFKR